MALGDRFVQKDWRDVYDLDKGGFEKGSWYPFRNVSRWMDMLDKRDTFNVSTEYDAPQDMNLQLTDLASQTASNIDSKTLSSFMEDLDGGASDMFYSGISSAPTQEAVDMARLQNPDLTGGAYGLDMKTGELMQRGRTTRYSSRLVGPEVSMQYEKFDVVEYTLFLSKSI